MSFVVRGMVVVGVGMAFAIGCGGSVSGGSPEGTTAAEFPAQLERLACDTLEPCCSAARLPFDRAACLKAFNVHAIPSGDGIAFDSAAARRCLDEFASATRNCSAFDKSQLPDCNLLTYGTLPPGAVCTTDRQCASTPGRVVTCQFEPGATAGTCSLLAATPHSARGEGCSSTCFADDYCEVRSGPVGPETEPAPPAPSGDCYIADGLYCDGGRHCQPIGNSGDTCVAHEGCSIGLVCIGYDQYTTDAPIVRPGTCGPPLPEGAPCSSSESCATLACDSATESCVHVPLATPGLCLGMPPRAD